jgi:putative ABC transport system permease protein
MVLVQGLRPVAVGLLAGITGAILSVGALRSLLYGVGELDPLTFGASAVVLLACAVAACLLPAWRAARIDPALALRAE